jgi:hypothetical protein
VVGVEPGEDGPFGFPHEGKLRLEHELANKSP